MTTQMIPEVKSVKKIGCGEDGAKSYRCDVELEVAQNGMTHKNIARLRMVNTTDCWKASP